MKERFIIRWILLFTGIILNALANILIKAGANRSEGKGFSWGAILQMLLNPFIVGGIVFFILALGAYSFSLTKFPLSIAYPIMTSLGLILVASASVVFFGESFGLLKCVGTLMILVGVSLISWSR